MIVTGEYGSRVLGPVRDRLERLARRRLRIRTVANEFFGGNVAVSGLLVGSDLVRSLAADRDGDQDPDQHQQAAGLEMSVPTHI